jgi:hypothetical protein
MGDLIFRVAKVGVTSLENSGKVLDFGKISISGL